MIVAASGGHWTKVASGPMAGKMAFVPKTKTAKFDLQGLGESYEAMYSGTSLVSIKHDDGSWSVWSVQNGKLGEKLGTYSAKHSAKVKMENMQALGYTKAVKYPDGGLVQTKIAKVGVKPLGAAPKTTKGVQQPKVTEAGTKTVKAETAAAQAQVSSAAPKVGGNITSAEFDALAAPIQITTAGGKTITKPGVDLGNGYMITKSSKGQYYLVDKATNKTVSSKYDSIEQAHAYAKQNTPYFDPPPGLPKSYTVFPDQIAAEKAIVSKGGLGEYYLNHSKANGYHTTNIIDALNNYQNGGYDPINDHLWKGKNVADHYKEAVKYMDTAFKKTATPYDMVAVRSKHQGSSLYKLAQGLEVGNTYHMKGFDSASLHYNNNWKGGYVRVIYRVPKGAPALIINGVHGKFHAYGGENELLFPRNTKWKVVGKKVSGGKIELHLDYDGWEF